MPEPVSSRPIQTSSVALWRREGRYGRAAGCLDWEPAMDWKMAKAQEGREWPVGLCSPYASTSTMESLEFKTHRAPRSCSGGRFLRWLSETTLVTFSRVWWMRCRSLRRSAPLVLVNPGSSASSTSFDNAISQAKQNCWHTSPTSERPASLEAQASPFSLRGFEPCRLSFFLFAVFQHGRRLICCAVCSPVGDNKPIKHLRCLSLR
jgi:hypothetical protein